jgi:hypothetical protein
MEFLIGRTLSNNIINLAADPFVAKAMQRAGWKLEELIEEEPDAGLGNGGNSATRPERRVWDEMARVDTDYRTVCATASVLRQVQMDA